MNEFIERCRQEWRRLGVADPVADEMAADLAADLAEAEAEGISAEEYLGRSAFDPRAFAESWAAERGVIPAPSAAPARRPLGLVAFTAVAALTLLVAVLLLATGQPQVSLVANGRAQPSVLPQQGSLPPPVISGQVQTSAAAPIEWILLVLAVLALGFAAWMWTHGGRQRPPAASAR